MPQKDNLSKSDPDAVEESINGFDISDDEQITKTAESLQMTQTRTGVGQVDGQKIDPGITEYLQTISTFPRSHMCVRNFSSHAEFLYNWMKTANGAVIVIE